MNKLQVLGEAIKRIGIKDISDDYLEFIEEGYGGRPYHNQFHSYMVVGVMSARMKTLDEIGFARFVIAAYFHDMCQSPADDLKAVNQSIDVMRSMLSGYLKEEDIETIANLILATGTLSPKNRWEELFIDSDWAIIGTHHWNTYRYYARQIEEEILAMGFHKEDFERGRIHFLQNTLRKEKIFLTPDFADLEWYARTNLRKELDGRLGGTWDAKKES